MRKRIQLLVVVMLAAVSLAGVPWELVSTGDTQAAERRRAAGPKSPVVYADPSVEPEGFPAPRPSMPDPTDATDPIGTNTALPPPLPGTAGGAGVARPPESSTPENSPFVEEPGEASTSDRPSPLPREPQAKPVVGPQPSVPAASAPQTPAAPYSAPAGQDNSITRAPPCSCCAPANCPHVQRCAPANCPPVQQSCVRADCECACDPRWPDCATQRRLVFGGWLDQGITFNGDCPADRYNGPVTFNDRDGEWQMNQLWAFAERAVEKGNGWDWGGRIDLLYGTDGRFTQAAGLEPEWGGELQPYELALPQFYLDVACEDWSLRVGHFFTLLGYEVVPAPNNFFYSHSYTMQYGEPFTHTGALVSREFGRLALTGGVHLGNDQFDDQDGKNALNFLGGATWRTDDERFAVACSISAGEQGPTIDQTIYSLVGIWNLGERFRVVLQHDLGMNNDSAGVAGGQWAGISQYYLYDFNDKWSTGLRYEWFRDGDGLRVTGLGNGNTIAGASFVGSFFELTWGVNWKPTENIRVRPECRWDWFDGYSQTAGITGPYDDGTDRSQFLFATDVLVTF